MFQKVRQCLRNNGDKSEGCRNQIKGDSHSLYLGRVQYQIMRVMDFNSVNKRKNPLVHTDTNN